MKFKLSFSEENPVRRNLNPVWIDLLFLFVPLVSFDANVNWQVGLVNVNTMCVVY